VLIGGLQKTTLIDYPGKVACTVFLVGCNFRCPWCYSSELVLPEKIKNQPKISKKEFLSFLKGKKRLLDGVVVCGGEPTLNKDLPEFLNQIKDLGFLVKLDTNGSNPKMLERLIKQKLVDYVAMDIKAPLEAKSANLRPELRSRERKTKNYDRATGVKVNLRDIRKSIEIIKKSGIDYEFRSTIVSGIHAKEDIIQMARDIAPAKAYFLQNFRPEKTLDPKFEKIKPYPKYFLLEIKKQIQDSFRICGTR